MTSRLIEISPDGYEPHTIHSGERTWTETNCYLDLWVEVLHSLGLDPVPAAACAFGARFDGSLWTFLSFTPEELCGPESPGLYRLRVACPEVDVSAGEPTDGTGADRRVGVDPGS